MGREIFPKMWDTGKTASVLIAEMGGGQISDEGVIQEWVKDAIENNAAAASDVRSGVDRAIVSDHAANRHGLP